MESLQCWLTDIYSAGIDEIFSVLVFTAALFLQRFNVVMNIFSVSSVSRSLDFHLLTFLLKINSWTGDFFPDQLETLLVVGELEVD